MARSKAENGALLALGGVGVAFGALVRGGSSDAAGSAATRVLSAGKDAAILGLALGAFGGVLGAALGASTGLGSAISNPKSHDQSIDGAAAGGAVFGAAFFAPAGAIDPVTGGRWVGAMGGAIAGIGVGGLLGIAIGSALD